MCLQISKIAIEDTAIQDIMSKIIIVDFFIILYSTACGS